MMQLFSLFKDYELSYKESELDRLLGIIGNWIHTTLDVWFIVEGPLGLSS